MHILNLEILKIIHGSDVDIKNSYEVLKYLNYIFGIASKVARIIFVFGTFVFYVTLKDVILFRIAKGEFNDSVLIGGGAFLFSFSILFGIEWVYKYYKDSLKVADKFFVFLKRIENGEVLDSYYILLDIIREAREKKEICLITAFCVAVLILIDVFEQELKSETLEETISNLSLLEGFSINEGLTLWGKTRVYLEIKEMNLAKTYLARYKRFNNFDLSAVEKLEGILKKMETSSETE